MNKKILLTSVMSIAMLTGVATGATYALFTAEDSVNIAVNAGKVNVSANVEATTLKTYSMGVEQTYGTFENGGTAKVDAESNLKLNLLTPGDRAVFTVKIDNNSNVNIKYRVVLAIEGELASGLVTKVVFNNREYPVAGGKTGWFELEAGKDIPDVTIDIELPVEAGNEYQEKKANITVKVEAIQGNAETVDAWTGNKDTGWYNASAEEYVISTAEELAGFAALVNGETLTRAANETFAGKTVKLGGNIDLKGKEWTPIGDPMSDGYVGFEGTFDGNGYTISNLVINDSSAWGQGLFGYNASKTTTIKNVTLNNVNITAEDSSGAVGGYFQFGTFENVAVTGDVAIKGAQHMGGIVGNGYYTNISGCSVIANEGSYITATTHSFAAGIVGYHCGNNFVIEDCAVENLEITAYGAVGVISGLAGNKTVITNCSGKNVVLNKTSEETLPSIGLVAGTWDGSENNCNITITNNKFDNITLNGKHLAYSTYSELVGSNYGGSSFLVAGTFEGNVIGNIANNLEEILPSTKVNSTEELNSVLSDATAGENVKLALSAGTYTLPSNNSSANIVISGAKNTVVDLSLGAYMENATITLKGVTIKGSLGYANGNGSDYAALYSHNVTYIDCHFNGGFRVGRDGAKFVNCTFDLTAESATGVNYVWTYGNDVTFEGCTFNTDGKAILVYSDGVGSDGISSVKVSGCTFNANAGAKAGAIANQNCAAIEVDNFGNGANVVTENNIVDEEFSGEWRIKSFYSGKKSITINGTEYTSIALDGKLMTIDANRNVTVQG